MGEKSVNTAQENDDTSDKKAHPLETTDVRKFCQKRLIYMPSYMLLQTSIIEKAT